MFKINLTYLRNCLNKKVFVYLQHNLKQIESMYLQVKNTTIPNHNIIRTSTETLFSDVRKQGWDIKNCIVSEIRDELVNTVYKGRDGKNIPSGSRQYATRAKSRKNLNKIETKIKMREGLSKYSVI